MKQIVVIILMLIYGIASQGMTINMHFCCGKMDNINIQPADQNSCNMHKKAATSMKAEGCCKNKQVELKIKDSYQQADIFQAQIAPFFAAEATHFYTTFIAVNEQPHAVYFYTDTSPPFATSYQKMYCIYRI
jgi:hypothetical protein